METNEMTWKRRDLSGIFIFDILPQDNGKKKPTCIEDCTEETRVEWLKTLDRAAIKRCGEVMNETMARLWNFLKPEEQLQFGNGKPYCALTGRLTKQSLIEEINKFCKLLKYLAIAFGVCTPNSEAALTDYK